MFDRETILPLTLGAILALLLHMVAAAAMLAFDPDDPTSLRTLQNRDLQQTTRDRPDLAILHAELPDHAVVNEDVTIQLTLGNLGSAPAPTSNAEFSLNQYPHAQSRTPALTPAATAPLTFTYRPDQPGVHTLRFTLDPQRELDDPDFRNNQQTHYLLVLASPSDPDHDPGLPDLAVHELTVTEPRIATQPAEATVYLANLSRLNADPVHVELRVNGQPVDRRTLPSGLAAASLHSVSFPLDITEPGEHEITAIVDPDRLLTETTTANNQLTRTWTWAAPDDAEKPPVGQDEPSPLAMNWISHEDFQDLLSRYESRHDQAAHQTQTEPVPVEQTPHDPTPLAPTQPDQPGAILSADSAQPATAPAPPPSESIAETTRPAETATVTEPDPPTPAETPESDSVIELALQPDPDPIDEVAEPDPTPAVAPATPEATAETATTSQTDAPSPPAPVFPAQPDDQPRTVTSDRSVPEATESTPITGERPAPVAIADAPREAEAGPDPLTDEPTPAASSEAERTTAPDRIPDPDAAPTDAAEPQPILTESDTPAALPIEAEADQPTEVAMDLPRTADELDPRPAHGLPLESAGKPTETQTPPASADRPEPTPDVPETPDTPATAEDTAAPAQPATTASAAQPTAAPQTRRQADPVTQIKHETIRPGAVIAQQGIVIETAIPRFSTVARYAAPSNPIVSITFDDSGQAIRARIDQSSGYENIDGPILSSLYRWRASGEQFKKREAGLILSEIKIILVPE